MSKNNKNKRRAFAAHHHNIETLGVDVEDVDIRVAHPAAKSYNAAQAAKSYNAAQAAKVEEPGFFTRLGRRIKGMFTRTEPTATGRGIWARLWGAVKSAGNTVIVKPASAVGRFFARIGRRVGGFFARVGRWIAGTTTFRVLHLLTRVALVTGLVAAWIAAFAASPMSVIIYTVAGYFGLEATGYLLDWLKHAENAGNRVAAFFRTFIHGLAKTGYVLAQIATAGLVIVGLVANPALLVLEVLLIAGLVWVSSRVEGVRWSDGECVDCGAETLTRDGLCRACMKESVLRATDPFVEGLAHPAMG